MRVLVGCETSGIVRDAFRAKGHDAWSCDVLSATSPWHITSDVRKVLQPGRWDMAIFHPPCTYLSASGMHWTTRGLRDPQLTLDALALVQTLMNAPIEKIAIENPIGRISTAIRKPDQIIQPWMFGEDASKATCLWLKGLPKLTHTEYVAPRWVRKGNKDYKRWANQTDSGQNRLGPSEDRWQKRSQTYAGIAQAMATQWG
jgi:hypothetical protein